MKTVSISIRIDPELLERIDVICDNRTQFFIEAAQEKLSPVQLNDDLTDTEKRNVIKGAKNLSDVMRDAILQEATRRKNFLSKMSNEDFARLVSGRLPKEDNSDNDLEADVLSLRECLAMLPSIEDITGELNRVKGELYKVERERDMNLALLKHAKNKVELAELMEVVYRMTLEYTANLVARKSLPGFDDGGGLSPKAYAEIADRVRKDLAELSLFRSGHK